MGSDRAGDELMAYPLTLSLMGFKCPFWCTLGVPRFMVPDSSEKFTNVVSTQVITWFLPQTPLYEKKIILIISHVN